MADEEDWDNTPEGIEKWLEWYDTLQPLKITPEEEAAAEQWLKQCSEYEREKAAKDVEDLFR